MNETTMTEAEYLDDIVETLYSQIASEIAGGGTEETKTKLEYLERLIRIRSDRENQSQKLDLDRKRPKQELGIQIRYRILCVILKGINGILI